MGAARLLRRKGAEGGVAISLVSPDDALVIRPRLYESDLSGVRVPLARLLPPVGIDHRHAAIEQIDVDRRKLSLSDVNGELRYDQLIICTGSEVPLPPGARGAHRVDTYGRAVALHEAVMALGDRPEGAFSATVVGAGFTGVEVRLTTRRRNRRNPLQISTTPAAYPGSLS